MSKILFVCKQSEDSTVESYGYFRKFSGLFNSARFINEMLTNFSVDSNIEIARDNNDIDRLVTLHRPDICIIEAYWVVPEKFEILAKLHPNIKWVIRIHSEVPFWATEGISMDWSLRYLDYKNVYLAPNSLRVVDSIKTILRTKYDHEISEKIVYLPNYYPVSEIDPVNKKNSNIEELHVGCFGAIRPLKNQLIQAIAAIEFANNNNYRLIFHINGNRIEGGGDPILKNLRNLFATSTRHTLVEHAWQPHSDFINMLKKIDIGMQVSYTETFNIVTADLVDLRIPVVVSPEVSWVWSPFMADPNSVDSIVRAMNRAMMLKRFGSWVNKYLLARYSGNSVRTWLSFIDNH